MPPYKSKDEKLHSSYQVHSKIDERMYWGGYEIKLWTAMLFVLTSTLFAARLAMPVCATAMAKEFGWNKADLGAVMGSFFWGYITTQILGGYMADRIGGDRVLWMSSLCWSIITFVTPRIAAMSSPLFSTMFLLMISRVMLGVTQGVHYPSMMSLLGHRICKTKRSLPIGIVTSASNFGTLVSGGIGSIMLEHHGWEETFYFTGMIGLILSYTVWTLARKPRQNVVSMDSMVYTQPTDKQKSEGVPWRLIYSKRCVWAFMAAHFCMNNCFYILLSWLPTFFHEHYPEEKGWVYNVVPWIFSIPSSVFGGWLSERLINAKCDVAFTRKLIQGIAMVGTAVMGLLLPFSPGFRSALFCAGLAVSLQTFHNSAVLVNPQDIVPKFAGSVFGVSNALSCIPSFVGVYITGHILEATANWSYVFLYMAGVNIMGISAFLIFGSATRIV